MTTMKIALGVMDAVRETMTVQLAANVTELGLSLLKKNLMIAMTLTNWPFPPATGAVPWTAKQIKEYAQQQRAQLPEAPL